MCMIRDQVDPIQVQQNHSCSLKNQRAQVDPIQDQRLAEFVVGSHMKNHPEHLAEEEQTG